MRRHGPSRRRASRRRRMAVTRRSTPPARWPPSPPASRASPIRCSRRWSSCVTAVAGVSPPQRARRGGAGAPRGRGCFSPAPPPGRGGGGGGAAATYGRDPTIYATGAVAAFAAGESRVADSLLAALEQLCHRCGGYYRREAALARAHGYAAAADSLLARSPAGP